MATSTLPTHEVPDNGNPGALLRVEHLKMHFPITKGVLQRQVGSVRAVDDISFTVARGETLGLGRVNVLLPGVSMRVRPQSAVGWCNSIAGKWRGVRCAGHPSERQ